MAGGDIVLALGVVDREARAAAPPAPRITSRISSCMAACISPATITAQAGAARRMEMRGSAHPAPARRAQPVEATRLMPAASWRAGLVGRPRARQESRAARHTAVAVTPGGSSPA